ncbi:MAG: ATP-binding cassette domain-containing protein [Verrucomicrobia bacterium]|nr:MAG: ATP-binding cassette domain-containing protein [Verrucomicrobiota bacterium]
MSAELLAIRGLTVRRDTTILHAIDWTIHPGEHWVLLGPNGCGKTTLLSALNGYMTPSAGTLSVLGATYGRTDWRELRKHIGFVSNALTRHIEPGETALDVVASGTEAVINLWKPPSPAEQRAALRLLGQWSCRHLANRPWAHLSQGERQRVLICRALAAKPSLLLLDEPCAGLDPVARKHLLALIEKQARKKRGPGLILITHHVEEITPAFTHVLLMRAGRCLTAGPIASTLTSENLSKTFRTRIHLTRQDQTWSLSIL